MSAWDNPAYMAMGESVLPRVIAPQSDSSKVKEFPNVNQTTTHFVDGCTDRLGYLLSFYVWRVQAAQHIRAVPLRAIPASPKRSQTNEHVPNFAPTKNSGWDYETEAN